MEFSILTPFFIGLASALHCAGMCGGIISALSFSLPIHIRASRYRFLSYVLAYSGGRITSYALAGSLLGALGSGVFGYLHLPFGHELLRILAASLLIGMGLYLAGWFPRFAQLEKIGTPLWRRLEPLGQRLLPVQSPLQAFGFGMIWGWLPCGLVYSTLLWSTASGGASHGGLYMLAFGLGTLPAVLTVGLLSGWASRWRALRSMRIIIGISLILLGILSLWFEPSHSLNSHLAEQAQTPVQFVYVRTAH